MSPSTGPEVMEHRVRILAEEPTREQRYDWSGAWLRIRLTVHQRTSIMVDRGRSAKVDLRACIRGFGA